jgi:N-sulfoglucosamine sulfohydrolase
MKLIRSTTYFCLCIILWQVHISGTFASAPDRPNILLILSDDHSVPYLGCYGNPDLKTPNLNKMASDGAMFQRAYTTAPQCVPSRAGILTGRSTIDIRMTRFSAPLPADIITFPEVLRENGYYTGICGRSYHLDGSGRQPEITIETFDKYNLQTFRHRVDYLNQGTGMEVIKQFQEFLSRVPEGKPFFMWANFSDPHRIFNATDYEPDPDKITLPTGFPDTEKVREDLAGHYGEIERLDYHVGLLFGELEQRGELENTVIVFMGDNGAALFRGKGTLYETGLNVPLIVRFPEKIKAGSVYQDLISGEDIAPTLLDFASLNPLPEMTGISFKPLMENQKYEGHQYVFAERGAHGSGLPANTGAFDLGRCIIGERYKLIYRALWQLPYHPVDFAGLPMWKELQQMALDGELEEPWKSLYFSSERPMVDLYDLEKDPYELNNLAGSVEFEKIEEKLKEALQEWMILNQDYLPLPVPPSYIRK